MLVSGLGTGDTALMWVVMQWTGAPTESKEQEEGDLCSLMSPSTLHEHLSPATLGLQNSGFFHQRLQGSLDFVCSLVAAVATPHVLRLPDRTEPHYPFLWVSSLQLAGVRTS